MRSFMLFLEKMGIGKRKLRGGDIENGMNFKIFALLRTTVSLRNVETRVDFDGVIYSR